MPNLDNLNAETAINESEIRRLHEYLSDKNDDCLLCRQFLEVIKNEQRNFEQIADSFPQYPPGNIQNHLQFLILEKRIKFDHSIDAFLIIPDAPPDPAAEIVELWKSPDQSVRLYADNSKREFAIWANSTIGIELSEKEAEQMANAIRQRLIEMHVCECGHFLADHIFSSLNYQPNAEIRLNCNFTICPCQNYTEKTQGK